MRTSAPAAPSIEAVAEVPPRPADEVEDILRSDSELAAWLADGERRRIQVLIAVPDGKGSVLRSGYRVDREYFYPASAVKLCVAFATLEKLDELNHAASARFTPRTTVRYVTGQGRGRRVVNTTIQRDIEHALVVSDNDAFNRLLDFVGPEELAERLARRGLTSARIAHHLGDATTTTPTIELLLADGTTEVVGQRIGFPIPPAPSASLGRAYRNERGRLVKEPMDFASKNAVRLQELQDMLIGVMRPDLKPDPADWQLRFRFLLVETLGLRPSDLDPGRIPRDGALDVQYKPLAVAIQSALPDLDVSVSGKGGRAYGFAVENAYVASEKTGRAFFVAATIYANDNDIMNDDRYEYGAVANPFLARLGVVLAQHLLLPPPSATALTERNDEHR